MKKIFLCVLIFLICTAAAVRAWYPAILTAYADFFTLHNASGAADALVVLSGGATVRFPEALRLYEQGYAPRILLTEVRAPNPLVARLGCDEKNLIQAMLEQAGITVPVELVPSLKGGATSTFDEAYDLCRYCRKNNFTRIIIVTDNHHTRRALYAFRKIFKGTGITVEASGVANEVFSASNWWRSDSGISAYILEGIKYIVYMLSTGNVASIKNY